MNDGFEKSYEQHSQFDSYVPTYLRKGKLVSTRVLTADMLSLRILPVPLV
jgi:hypothetical protein